MAALPLDSAETKYSDGPGRRRPVAEPDLDFWEFRRSKAVGHLIKHLGVRQDGCGPGRAGRRLRLAGFA